MRHFLPQTLRTKIFLFTLIISSIPILLFGYMVKLKSQEALLEEKQAKLFGVALLLDKYLDQSEGYDKIIRQRNAQNADRQTKIKVLNDELKDYTDILASAYPGIGVGYYSKDLDAIVTYGPSSSYADKLGISIEPTHPGREVMQTNERLVRSAPLVRGDIMNAMTPIVRQNKVIGYIWANELTADIYAQLAAIDRNIYLSITIGIIISLLLSFWLTRGFISNIETIKNDLEKIQFDLSYRISPMKGEMKKISDAINHMARSLSNAQTLNENIMHSIADGVITVDIEGKITSVNKSAETLTGFTCSEILGSPYKEIFCDGHNFYNLLLDTLLAGTNYIGIEIDYPVKNKSIYISISTSRLKDSTDNIIGAVVVFKDLTEQHRLKSQIRRSERLASLGELMAGIAHEIRNPLTAVKGFVQYLKEVDDEKERKEYMPLIIKEVDRVNRVIETLLYFARPCKTNYTLVDINNLLEETLVLVKNMGAEQQLELMLDLDKTIPQVEGDAEQLKQVLLNLLINAVQATPGSGKISVNTWHEDSCFVYLSVTDTGSGINQADLNKIFDPFFTTKVAGTGLGLAIAQRIINAHYGRIDIQSELGRGTKVTLQIPTIHYGGETDEYQLYSHGCG